MEYISCNMGTCDLPEIYVLTLGLRPRACAYISGKSLVPMLQLLLIVLLSCTTPACFSTFYRCAMLPTLVENFCALVYIDTQCGFFITV